MERIAFEVEFVTPCFLGGADNTNTAEWRAASIRGQLRWWLRAVAGGKFAGDLQKVVDAETRLFGSTNASGSVRLRVGPTPSGALSRGTVDPYPRNCGPEELLRRSGGDPRNKKELARVSLGARPSNPINYLAYGCLNFVKPKGATHGRVEAVRPAIAPGEVATFEVRLVRPLSDDDRELLARSLWAWLHLGGIGARCRRGLGSLALRHAQTLGTAWPSPLLEPPGTPADFIAAAKWASGLGSVEPTHGQPADWSHFSSKSRILVSATSCRTWDNALELAGIWLIAFRRRYGHPEDSRVVATAPLAQRDYVWAAPNARAADRFSNVPDRAGFGLPLPFDRTTVVTWGDGKRDARRASPLLIHIARIGEGNYHPVLTHLPARLTPDAMKLVFKDWPATAKKVSFEQENVVSWFLDDLARKKLVTEIS